MRKHYTPPPTFEIQNQNQGTEDIMDIDSNIFFNVENSIKREMRKNCFSTKKNKNKPPPPRIFFLYTNFVLMLEIARNAKKTWNIEKKKITFYFFQYLKNSNNIPSISKTIQHTPMTWYTYLQSFEKIHQCVF